MQVYSWFLSCWGDCLMLCHEFVEWVFLHVGVKALLTARHTVLACVWVFCPWDEPGFDWGWSGRCNTGQRAFPLRQKGKKRSTHIKKAHTIHVYSNWAFIKSSNAKERMSETRDVPEKLVRIFSKHNIPVHLRLSNNLRQKLNYHDLDDWEDTQTPLTGVFVIWHRWL